MNYDYDDNYDQYHCHDRRNYIEDRRSNFMPERRRPTNWDLSSPSVSEYDDRRRSDRSPPPFDEYRFISRPDTRAHNDRRRRHDRHRTAPTPLQAPRGRHYRQRSSPVQSPVRRRRYDRSIDQRPSSPAPRPKRIDLDMKEVWMPRNLGQNNRLAQSRRPVDTVALPSPPINHVRRETDRGGWRVSDDEVGWSDDLSRGDSDALSVFAHIHTDTDSFSSDNGDNFDHDDDEEVDHDIEKGHRRSLEERSNRPKSVKQKIKPKAKQKSKENAPPKQIVEPVSVASNDDSNEEVNTGSGSDFTMGSTRHSVVIEAFAPMGDQVSNQDTATIGAILWLVDYLDKFTFGMTILLTVTALTSLLVAVLTAQATLYVVVGVYVLLWFVINRESRRLQDQVRHVHDSFANMNATELARVDLPTIARTSIETTAQQFKKIIQVSAGGSGVFDLLLIGLSSWAQQWAAMTVALVALIISMISASSSLVIYRHLVDATNKMIIANG
uniref:Uncharacterized protein n=1 Tax=Spongospora subterranea TaxID=70186 RepID=A0A0H5QUP3_9EUKA|eukprot:CRZ05467.1 hypothetical protein [Spongospora subterranea]